MIASLSLRGNSLVKFDFLVVLPTWCRRVKMGLGQTGEPAVTDDLRLTMNDQIEECFYDKIQRPSIGNSHVVPS